MCGVFFHFGDTQLGGLTLTMCFTALKGVAMALFYLWEDSTMRRSKAQNILGTEEEQAALLPNDT